MAEGRRVSRRIGGEGGGWCGAHLELGHGVNVLHVKLDARSVGRLCHPHVQVHALPDLEEDAARAPLELGDLVHDLLLLLRVELVFLLAAGQELEQVLVQVPVPGR